MVYVFREGERECKTTSVDDDGIDDEGVVAAATQKCNKNEMIVSVVKQ